MICDPIQGGLLILIGMALYAVARDSFPWVFRRLLP